MSGYYDTEKTTYSLPDSVEYCASWSIVSSQLSLSLNLESSSKKQNLREEPPFLIRFAVAFVEILITTNFFSSPLCLCAFPSFLKVNVPDPGSSLRLVLYIKKWEQYQEAVAVCSDSDNADQASRLSDRARAGKARISATADEIEPDISGFKTRWQPINSMNIAKYAVCC